MAVTIEHVVVLMLENRSFDSLLGRLYPERADFDGLTGKEFNVWHRKDGAVRVPVWADRDMTRADARGPAPDPGALFRDMQVQLWGLDRAETPDRVADARNARARNGPFPPWRPARREGTFSSGPAAAGRRFLTAHRVRDPGSAPRH